MPVERRSLQAAAAALLLVAATAAAAPQLQFDHDDPLFRLLTAAPQQRFAVAAEIVLDPETIATDEIRQRVAVAPFKYLFRASKTAQAALDFVLLKRDGGAVPPPPEPETSLPPNVLLISVAGLRADAVGAYGATRPTTPRLDALAAEGAAFADASAPSSWSLPGNASLLTGQYPSRHGLESIGAARETRLDRAATTLAEALVAGGYDTAALVADRDLAPLRGVGDGFELFLQRPAGAVEMATLARLWLDWRAFHVGRGLEAPSFFLFLQLNDPGSGGAPDARYAALFPPRDASPRAAAEAAYAAAVRAVDDQIGVVLDALAGHGVADRTLVVVTSSHGLDFGEDGSRVWGTALDAAQVQVPLLLRLPATVAAGQKVDAPVSLVDLAPTVLSWTGRPPLAAADGVDLSAIVRAPGEASAPALPDRALFAELGPAERDWEKPFHERAVRSGAWRLTVRRNADGTNVRRLFRAGTDLAEVRDPDADPEARARLAELEEQLRRFMEAAPQRTPLPTPAPPTTDHDHP